MHGEWQGDVGTLTENFTYSNGQTQGRKWHLTVGPDNTFKATADDIVGEAQSVLPRTTAMLTYRIILPKQAGGYILTATDWMYLTENGVILNRSELRKFGKKLQS